MAGRAWGFVIVFIMAGLLGTAPASAQSGASLPAEDAAAIQSVISRQLDAFQRDAGVEAFSYASPSIRAMFGTPDNFMAMVRRGYQPVYRPRSVEFAEALSTPRGPIQRVLFIGPDGRAVVATYFMERQADGTWRIDGVTLDQAPGLSA
jgi:hypothetical protein